MVKTPNAEQKQVIEDVDNNIILFASAGTGKTFTVANRIANILSSNKASANEILCLTFTIKACKELEEDVYGYAGAQSKSVCIKTIHSFCYQLLQEENKRFDGKYYELGVCDEIDQEEILKNILSSRSNYWILEENLKERGLSLPNLSDCPLYKIEGEESIYFLYEDCLIGLNGEVYDLPIDKSLIPATIQCPACGKEQIPNENKCVECKNEFAFELNKRVFEITGKRAGLQNFVTQIKHYRESQGFYTQDEIADNQNAFNYIKETNPTLYEGLISYYARYIGSTPDEDFAELMSRFAGRFLTEYNERLSLSNLLDFDDLIIKANAVLSSEEGLSRWSQKFRYIVVDEMQDTSVLEYSLLKKLFSNTIVMLCGDFFQTIYEWRGSKPSIVLDGFIQEFSPKIYMFSENYRATKTLASASFGFLKNAYPHLVGKFCPKDLQINSADEGEKITCHAFSNQEEEAWQIYNYLQAHRPNNPTDICIMARSNKYIAELANHFERFNAEKVEEEQIPFFTVEENCNFFKKSVVKDVLAVLKLLVTSSDRMSMERLTEKFVRGVGVKTIENLRLKQDIGVSILSFLDPQAYEFGDTYHHLIEGYRAENIVIYDTETTGLDLEKDEIVQISAVKINADGNIIDSLDLFVEPTIEICKEAYETHGFDLAYIKDHGGLTAVEALQRFSAFVEDCVLVGHNNFAFDRRLVDRQLQDNNLPPLRLQAEYDTLIVAKEFYPQLENYKLATLCERFSIVNEHAHNAFADITATGKCLVAMLQDKVIPTAFGRIAFIIKHREKFEKIYAFIEEMKARLKNGEELGAYAIKRLKLKSRYTSNSDLATMRDLIQSLLPVQEEGELFLREYLRDAALSGSQMDILIKKLNRIPIITVHQSKGCEYDTVILAGADDNHFPNYAARQSGNEEEEKKIFYVAITRAKRKLIITRSMRNGKYERRETPYFWLIPEEFVKVNRAWKNAD